MSKLPINWPREQLERVVRQVVRERLAETQPAGDWGLASAYSSNLVVNVSARHVHLSAEHLDRLFGTGAKLAVYRWLYQPGEFAAEQTVTIISPGNVEGGKAGRRAIQNVRVLGPVRRHTQAEISFTDAMALGLEVPVRPSGQIDGTPGCLILGPNGVVELDRGLIRAQRHVHMSPADAAAYGFADGQPVRLHVAGDCPTTFEGLQVRVDPRFLLEVHLDTDEGNACDLVNATGAELSG